MIRNALIPLVLACMAGQGLAQDKVEQVINSIVEGERQMVARLAPTKPFVETYIQELDPSKFTPVRDDYMLMRLDLTGGADGTLTGSESFKKPSWWMPLRRAGKLTFQPSGWARMAFFDLAPFDRSTYKFEYSRREFLGDVRCLVFEVSPANQKETGRFVGRIWVEDQGYKIVRFNGTYSGGTRSAMFFHLDSWRVNVAPGQWAPAFVYVEEGDTSISKFRFKAQVRLWAYGTGRSTKMDELAQVLIESNAAVDEAGPKDNSPMESQRAWEREAERNVIEKLERSGLMAPAGEVDKVLNTVVNNLIVTNNIDKDVRCRVVLTTPLETFFIGQTIVISRGLLDVLPDEASLAMVLSGELAHIALGHRTPTSFAFGDATMFDDRQILDRLNMRRTPEEIAAAGKKSLEILSKSPYKDKLGGAGLFLKEVDSRMASLPNLVRPNMGNRFVGPAGQGVLGALTQGAPALDANKIDQIAALPLGSRVKVDVWTNRISMVKTTQMTVTSAREKMPLEVTPMMLHLTRVEAAAETEQQFSAQ